MPRNQYPTYYLCVFENCSAGFRHREKYENHLRWHTGERPFICTYDNCNKNFRRKAHLKRHHEAAHEPDYNCTFPGCDEVLKTRENFRKHMKVCHLHEKKKYKCDLCDEVFDKHNLLNAHKYVHTGLAPFKCSEPNCDRSFLKKSKLKQHMKYHKGYSCKEANCDKIFQKWTHLQQHMKEHKKDEVKTYKCQECDRVFNVKCNLKSHYETHKDERQVHHCPINKCTRFYLDKKNLNYHIKNFHSIRTIPCTFENCHLFFKTQDDLSKHMVKRHQQRRKRKREPPKPLFASVLAGYVKAKFKDLKPEQLEKASDPNNLDICNADDIANAQDTTNDGDTTITENEINTDDETSIKDKTITTSEQNSEIISDIDCTDSSLLSDFKCHYCEKVFPSWENLKTHYATHEQDIDIFNCPIPKCTRFYLNKKNLNDHLKNFHEEKPIACTSDRCSLFFKTKDTLRKHLTRQHQEKKETPMPTKPDRSKTSLNTDNFEDTINKIPMESSEILSNIDNIDTVGMTIDEVCRNSLNFLSDSNLLMIN